MANAREVQLRIKSVKNIAQVTRALQAVSASRVRKAMERMFNTRPYATKAWQVLTHVAKQPGRQSLHPLLTERKEENGIIVIMLSGDRGLAGAYNTNILKATLDAFAKHPVPVRFISVGRKGTELLHRRGMDIMAEFTDLPPEPSFNDVSAIGRLAVDEFLEGKVDSVYLMYTDFVNMVRQDPINKKLLPLEIESSSGLVEAEFSESTGPSAAYVYEPGQTEILDEIVPRFTALQIFQATLESLASEHASRMVAMQNATDNATELAGLLQLEYNKARQLGITSDILDIVGGAEALAKTK
ncbi:MAG: ATP synthase F1 subunit gamma [Chloroflexi bacterium]|jgi:F-type H+-transporting ATPase subunit gamma|nr:ATP synthase F1 subunit gamma [Chloroflexota bacterium]MBT3671301.1 ATP synthase F1 subunit gamma [Chloroflexota bacterium]MBT4001756.1 ATP synthase F1 subunit gamma [Chloroflexota bacterium]MBT4304240.1 ATP synthase F1 subunit gamma [Chloroflexota bacterium]MBT4534259.1 ATP synthase F1 subunit gamma [Chloroflexota bacterium]